MGARGPQRTPTALLVARGSRKGKRRAAEEAVSEVAAPPCPKFLVGEARAEWDRVVPELLTRRTLSRADMATLTIYCRAWGEFLKVADKLDKDPEGYVVQTEKGIAVHPLVTVLKGLEDTIIKAADRFGMSPAAKARVKATDVSPKKEANTKARFFGGAGPATFTGPRLAGTA